MRLTRRRFLMAAGVWGSASWIPAHLFCQSPGRRPAGGNSRSETYRRLVLSHKPVGYWRLRDAKGATGLREEITGKPLGTLHGAVRLQEAGSLGDAGAIGLDGNSFVEIPDDPRYSQPTSNEGLTVEVWMRPDRLDVNSADGKYVHWLGKGRGSGDGGRQEWGFRLNSADNKYPKTASAYIWNPVGGLGAGARSPGELVERQWIHFVACYEAGDASTVPKAGVQLYVDGTLAQGPLRNPATCYDHPAGPWRIFPKHGPEPVRLGTRDGDGYLTGALAEFAIYPRVLTAEQIAGHYRAATEAAPQRKQ